MIKKEIKVFSPATVANLSCGYDVMGLAITGLGDTLVFRQVDEPGARIFLIDGADLPMEADKNIASFVANSMLKKAKSNLGFDIEIYKGAMGGSGLGSSASSSAGAAIATNYFLNNRFSTEDLIMFAAEGERLACGSPITDNVAPAILGGIVFIQDPKNKKFFRLPFSDALHLVIIHPQVEVTTEESRSLLPKDIPMKIVTRQMANIGSFISSFYKEDYDLMKSCMTDFLAEPYRFPLIDGYKVIRKAAMEAGAIGGGISGSGPSVFHFCKGKESAEQVYKAINEAYKPVNVPYKMYLSTIDTEGTRIIE